jgi:hypothetical protein
MFDFSSLTVVCADDSGNSYSFVGIGVGELRLPKGCMSWAVRMNGIQAPAERFGSVRDAFLELYKTLRVYRKNIQQNLVNDRDSAQAGARGGMELLGEHEDGEIIYYRHLDMLDSILDVHDELAILSLAQRLGRSERLDSTKLHRHLDCAVYLDDGGFFVDEMAMPRHQVIMEPVEIVQMYCFVLTEVRRLLEESDMLTSDIRVLGGQFFENHLVAGDGLFVCDTWRHTREVLCERLSIIDKNTAFKDDGYYALYEALTRFLYGSPGQDDQGLQWGISTFAPVFEAICLVHLIGQRASDVIACDTTGLADFSPIIPGTLTYIQELRLESKLVGRLHSTPDLAEVFVVNGAKLFPDCVVAGTLYDTIRASLCRHYGIQSLSDNRLAGNPPVDVAFQECWQGIKSCNGPTQRADAPKLLALLKTTTPSPVTAFFLGRAIAGAYESSGGSFDSRERIFNQLIDDAIGTPRHIEFLRGIIWETYFDKNDEFREGDDLAERKKLFGYKCAMQCVFKNLAGSSQFSLIQQFAQKFEIILQEFAGQKKEECIVVDFKYLTKLYFARSTVEARERSVRKQFVYEYLLSKKFDDSYRISSEFWIPAFDADVTKVDLGLEYSEYLGKCIPMRQVNVVGLMREYLRESV